ncbi:MAG: DUF2065 domain-containing protein [Woeseiaceae bacterium]
MWQDIFTAFSLYLVIEGMIPFMSPNRFRQAVAQIARLDDNHLRVTGLSVMFIGLVLLFIVR